MGKRKMALSLLIIFNITILSSCWDIREINEIGIVIAVGIDKPDGSNRYSVTVQIANPSTDNSSDGKSGAKSKVWIGTGEGASIFDATRMLVEISSRRIMWAHNNVVIIGESLAKEGIIPVVDYFTHNPELRMKSAVVIAKGDAREYLVTKIGMENPPGMSFVSLEGYRPLIAETLESRMLEVSSALKGEYENPLISEVHINNSSMVTDSDKESDGKYARTLALEGLAVFKKDKMIGSLSPEESRGIAWVLNQTKNTAVTVIDTEHDNKSVTVETKGVKAKIKSKVVNGMPGFSINVSGKGEIVEENGSTNKNITEIKEHVAALLDKRIENEIKNSLKIIQKKYMVDCLGFAAIVHTQNEKEWHEGLKKNWQEIFPQIPVTVSADIKIKTSTLNQEPMKIY